MADHFSEDDARRIFARAAERQGAGNAPPDGLSLDELKAIGEASGIDPKYIAAAVAEHRRPEPERSSSLFGVPSRMVESRLAPGTLSDAAWGQVVEDLRATFRQTGVATDIGSAREWTTSTYGRDGLRFTARPADGGTELTLELDQRDGQKAYRGVAIAFAALTAVLTVLPFVLGKPDGWMFGPSVGLCLALSLALPFLMTRGQVRHAERTFGPLLDRAELAARRDAEPASTEPVSTKPVSTKPVSTKPDIAAPRLDLPDAELDAGPPAPARRRRRSR